MKLLLPLLFLAAPATQDSVVDEPTGVKISFVLSKADLPEEWSGEKSAPKWVNLEGGDREQCLRVVRKALRKYPDGLLLENLAKIYVLKELSFFGEEYGATNDTIDRVVYLTYQNYYPPKYLEQSLHAELSTVLLYRNQPTFKLSEWKSLNSKEFIYSEPKELKVGADVDTTAYSPTLFKRGYLSLHSTTGADSDFKTIAEGLFTNPPGFWKAVDKNPKLRLKVNEALVFYKKLSPQFTEKFFRSQS